MNWFMYIGGGFILLELSFMLKTLGNEPKDKPEWNGVILHLISTLAVWVWICWRFIV